MPSNQDNQAVIESSTAPSQPAAPAVASPSPPAPPVPAPVPPPAPAPAPPVPVTGVANGSNKGTKVELQTSYTALVAGLLAYYQPGDVFHLKEGDLTRDELIAKFSEFIAAAEATKASNQVWRADVQNERVVEIGVRPLRAGVHKIVTAKFGNDGVQLLGFGFTPEVPHKRTVEAMAAGLEKARATRKARGTKGAVQRAEVQGNVAGVVITPVTATLSTDGAGAQPAPAPAAPAAAPAGAATTAAKS